MNTVFILNPSSTTLNIKDAIDERLSKIKGILNCLIFAIEYTQEDQELDSSSAYHALWAIDGFLDEINCLQQKYVEIKN